MNFNDDEDIVLPPSSGPTPVAEDDRVQLVLRYNPVAPLEEIIQKMTLEITGEEKSRSGLDLVAVLDVSGSMDDQNKLDQLKTAMLFLITKLDIVDRLSIIKYSNHARRLCPLSQMTESSRMKIENSIKSLKANGGTNITDGLETALKVLKDRKFSKGRVGAIMLMSDGVQNRGGDAAKVQVGDVPVHTFGFGDGQDAVVLQGIANNSRLGGTYSDVRMANLNKAFSQCLAGLLSVVAQDLTVTITPEESTLKQVSAGRYPQILDNGSVTIRFGDLYRKEVRKVLVEPLLPAISAERGAVILEVAFTYKFDGQEIDGNPSTASVRRRANLTDAERQTPPEVRAEEVRVQIADVIKQATADADKKELIAARERLVKGIKTLQVGDKDQLKAALMAELEELHELMKTQTIYDSQGRSFAYSLVTSHNTQRQAARGSDIGKFQLYVTPAMSEFIEEAKKFDDVDDLQVYMEEVIKALESVETIIDQTG